MRGHLIESFAYDLAEERAESYATANYHLGSPLDSIFGSIGCTKIHIQSLSGPSGLIFNMYGPEVGYNDKTLYCHRGMAEKLLDAMYQNF